VAVEYLLQETGGANRIILEDGTGWLLLESSDNPPSGGGDGSDRINVGTPNFGTTIQVGFGM
jgi:hypothetical protein